MPETGDLPELPRFSRPIGLTGHLPEPGAATVGPARAISLLGPFAGVLALRSGERSGAWGGPSLSYLGLHPWIVQHVTNEAAAGRRNETTDGDEPPGDSAADESTTAGAEHVTVREVLRRGGDLTRTGHAHVVRPAGRSSSDATAGSREASGRVSEWTDAGERSAGQWLDRRGGRAGVPGGGVDARDATERRGSLGRTGASEVGGGSEPAGGNEAVEGGDAADDRVGPDEREAAAVGRPGSGDEEHPGGRERQTDERAVRARWSPRRRLDPRPTLRVRELTTTTPRSRRPSRPHRGADHDADGGANAARSTEVAARHGRSNAPAGEVRADSALATTAGADEDRARTHVGGESRGAGDEPPQPRSRTDATEPRRPTRGPAAAPPGVDRSDGEDRRGRDSRTERSRATESLSVRRPTGRRADDGSEVPSERRIQPDSTKTANAPARRSEPTAGVPTDYPRLVVDTASATRDRTSSREGSSSQNETAARNGTTGRRDDRPGTDRRTSATARGRRPGHPGDANETRAPTSVIPERGVELERLVDRLYRELERKSRIERERMGS